MRVTSVSPFRRLLPLAGLILLAGAARAGVITIDPAAAPVGTDLTNFYAADGVTLSTVNGAGAPVVSAQSFSSTPVFGWKDSSGNVNDYWWQGHSPDFQAGFNFGANSVSIDAFGNFDLATLSAYDSSMNLLGTTTQAGNTVGGPWTLTYNSASNDIYGIRVTLASAFAPDESDLTNLVITTGAPSAVPEPGSLALLVIGGLPLAGLLRRRRTAH